MRPVGSLSWEPLGSLGWGLLEPTHGTVGDPALTLGSGKGEVLLYAGWCCLGFWKAPWAV